MLNRSQRNTMYGMMSAPVVKKEEGSILPFAFFTITIAVVLGAYLGGVDLGNLADSFGHTIYMKLYVWGLV